MAKSMVLLGISAPIAPLTLQRIRQAYGLQQVVDLDSMALRPTWRTEIRTHGDLLITLDQTRAREVAKQLKARTVKAETALARAQKRTQGTTP